MMGIATAQDDQDDAAGTSVALGVGDPVIRVATGGVTLSPTTNAVWGVIWGPCIYWDGTTMVQGNYVPNQTAWGAVESRRSMVAVMPAKACYWEVDCDDATTATTRAAYHALIFRNVDHYSTASGGRADTMIDISGHATTEHFSWTIYAISETKHNRDFSGAYVKLVVAANDSEEAGSAATNIAGL